MKTVMIILGKGFSSRIPGKNLKDFCGHPLIAWSIVQSVNSKMVDETWVTTESQQVAEVSEHYGAKVMFRGYQDNDFTPGTIPMQEAVKRLLDDGVIGLDDSVICRLCTTPHLLPGDVDRCVAQYEWLFSLGYRGLGVAARLRTHIISKWIGPGQYVSIGREWQAHNDYSILKHLAFIGIQPASALLPTDEPIPLVGNVTKSVGHFVEVQPWQMQDMDTFDEWEMGELVANHYILKGKDMMEVYSEVDKSTRTDTDKGPTA